MTSVTLRLGAFVLVLVAIFGLSYAVGSAIGPIATTDMPTTDSDSAR